MQHIKIVKGLLKERGYFEIYISTIYINNYINNSHRLFLYLIKNRSDDYLENYYGLSDIIINTDYEEEKNRENIKIVLRAIASSVYYVEKNFKKEPKQYKRK